jgi:hypothetical protein
MNVPRHRTALAALGIAEVLKFVHHADGAANRDADFVCAASPRQTNLGGEQRLDGGNDAGGGH